MIRSLITFSVRNKLMIFLAVAGLIGWGLYSLTQIPIGAVPDITNNQVQIITTSRNLATEEVEKFITYPVELEMSNLPGVEEIRSISKFGLSVVTVVFDDDLGTYLPRQLISEKLKSAAEQIPSQFGTPEMGPITTGLGEIYQYVLDVRPGYEDKYSTMDLRTIQDWVVKRQLAGIDGVVEVNTWGGFLKQYEVALDPQKLRALNVSALEVYEALEKSNDVTGGGYIERYDESYFIRGDGLIRTIEEMGEVVIKNVAGRPILVKDVAELSFGYATRFGAITGNGQGEKVMGQIMMLKDANTSKVIESVKERIAEVQKTLPEGVYINPFLERTELINKTTSTVTENLVLGALIVIFVIVLLLGDLRSGLIVASVIPLSLLFGISMMNVFGISANLMSLGAIDFGIIIDGAVIIVEFILFQFSRKLTKAEADEMLTREDKDELTIDSASKVIQPAIFGQIIILIVFIPILALSGVEGKMFGPMALSFSFTLIGAMILCLTYVPMISSLVISGKKKLKQSGIRKVSTRLVNFLYGYYEPVLRMALKRRTIVLSLAAAFLIGAVIIFSRLGGEFVPTLDEGDYVVQPILKTGTSLSKTIELMTQLEQILKENFPEVDQVVSRIGAAEVPTDPMSMEETDVIIKLRPKSEWVSASSKSELAEKMKEAMSVVPGVEFEFTQPIEMRFNELITGVRSDLAIKIYGEDLDTLFSYANKVDLLVRDVSGVGDLSVEKIDKLPQIQVSYDRRRLAELGLSTSELNRLVNLSFGGSVAGSVYEGEKRFDLVVKFQESSRQNIGAMQNLFIDLPNGRQIPLREVADISYTQGPAKISRDDTKRRVVIGINVRNRDVGSLVEEIQGILGSKLNLPDGYSITYGGQFENLENAVRRLTIAVPVALVLILIMLHFAFKSFRLALLVYSAIPLAAIGGVMALWIRGLPFSISAGVGFIALFGIAVLNGIVLIEFFTDLKNEGMGIKERIMEGTKLRLRPVLLTAGAAALGFLPMAISTSAGAEVQRPLATVVIGGLVTSTLLTLIVLPILYQLFGEPKKEKSEAGGGKIATVIVLMVLAFLVPNMGEAQERLTLEQAIERAVSDNPNLAAYELNVQKAEYLKKSSFDLGKTSVYHVYDANNIAANGNALRVFGAGQSIPFPTVLGSEGKLAQRKIGISQAMVAVEKTRITREVSKLFYEITYLREKIKLATELDSLFEKSYSSMERQLELGGINQLDILNAKAHLISLLQQLEDFRMMERDTQVRLGQLLNAQERIDLASTELVKLSLKEKDISTTSSYELEQARLGVSEQSMKLEKNKWLPDINLEYFVGLGSGPNSQNYSGYQIGLSFPLFFNAQNGRTQSMKVQYQQQEKLKTSAENKLLAKQQQLNLEINNIQSKLNFYESEGLEMATEIMEMAERRYSSGEASYLEFIKSIENAQMMKMAYLDYLNSYNQLVLENNYLTID